MKNRSSLRSKLVFMAFGGPFILGIAITVLLGFSEQSSVRNTETTLRQEMHTNLANVGKGVYDMVSTQDQLLRQKLTTQFLIGMHFRTIAGLS